MLCSIFHRGMGFGFADILTIPQMAGFGGLRHLPPAFTKQRKPLMRTASKDTVRIGTERKLHEETELSIIIV